VKSTYALRLLPALCFWIVGNAWSAGPFNILDYGATNDGVTPATDAIRSAIQAAKSAGGGTVYIPAGKLRARACRSPRDAWKASRALRRYH